MITTQRKIHCGFFSIITLVFGMSLMTFSQSNVIRLTDSKNEKFFSINVVEQDFNHTRIKISVNGFETNNVEVEKTKKQVISIPGMVHVKGYYSPKLPQLFQIIQIPDCAKISFKIIEKKEKILEDKNFGLLKKQLMDTNSRFYKAFSHHFQNGEYPGTLFNLMSPIIIRDIRGVKFCFNPIRYSQKTNKITFTNHIVVDILYENEESTLSRNEKINKAAFNYKLNNVKRSPVFESIYPNLFLNYNPKLSDSFSKAEKIGKNKNNNKEEMIIITCPKYETALKSYIQWKQNKNINVKLDVSSAGIGIDAIHNTIREKYKKDGLTYILLVGDIDDVPSPLIKINGIPSFLEPGFASDPSYALLEGDDFYGDALISRISCKNVSELKNQLNKIMIYEKALFSEDDWIFHSIIAATVEFDGVKHADLIEKAMLNHPQNFKEVIKIMETDSNPTGTLKDVIEKSGANIIVYNSHGSETGFGSIPFTVSDVATLKGYNGSFPIIHGGGCLTGNFNYNEGDCFAEAVMKASSDSGPSGVVAMLAFTTISNPITAMFAQKEAYTKFYYINGKQTIGALIYLSNLFTMGHFNCLDAEELYRKSHLFGDCSMPIWKLKPAN